jgi:hypothetical protein
LPGSLQNAFAWFQLFAADIFREHARLGAPGTMAAGISHWCPAHLTIDMTHQAFYHMDQGLIYGRAGSLFANGHSLSPTLDNKARMLPVQAAPGWQC